MALELLDDLAQTFVLSPLGEQHRLQGSQVVRQRFSRGRHVQRESYSTPPRERKAWIARSIASGLFPPLDHPASSVLIPIQAAHQNEMIAPAVTE
jgi:hypothetical protein